MYMRLGAEEVTILVAGGIEVGIDAVVVVAAEEVTGGMMGKSSGCLSDISAQ